jgi:CHAT domain-containing protein
MNVPPKQSCPVEDVLQEVAAGIGSEELALQTMQHVARCSDCARALRWYIREFSDEQSPENAVILKQLESSSPEWQKRLVREAIGGRKRFPWLKLVPVMTALAVAILAVVQGPVLLSEFKLKQAQKQAAAAFAERRTTEMRLTAVDHAPYRPFPIVLGAENGRGIDEVPTSLHDASGAANKHLLASNADPRWLQIQGRALLWEATPSSLEKAEKDFEKARAAGLESSSLEIDLAASYFERDSKSEHPNLQRTLNLLSEVLSKQKLNPDDRASALYNLAITYEKTQAWDLAVATWEKYLQADSSSSWTEEARQHLKDAKAKIPANPQQSYSDPSFFLQQKAQGKLRPEDPEQYQQKALSQWLPVAMADKESDAYRAIRALSAVLSEEHSDQWMTDFILAASSSDTLGVQALSAAVLTNAQGFHNNAVTQAELAERVLGQQKNVPGKLFAQFQALYAKRSLLLGSECLSKADRLWDAVSSTKYLWLQAQVALERAQCKNFLGELAESDSDSKLSLTLAQRAHFPVLELRVFGISASMHHQQGRCDGAWEQGIQGLKRYWEGAYPRDRLDQFYAVMWQCTEESGALYAAEALLQHTLALRQTSAGHNSFREAMLHLRLRNMFLSQRQYALAAAEDADASSLLKNLKEDEKRDPIEYRLINDIEPAELQLQQGDPERALATIKEVGNTLKTVQNDFIKLSVDRVSGNIYRGLGRFSEAITAYQNAIKIAEDALESLRDGDERLKWLKATDDSYRGLVRVLLEQKNDEEALKRWEWYQSRPLLQGLHTAGHQGSELQKKKSTRLWPTSAGTRLIYANFQDGLQIWIFNGKVVQSTWVKVRQQDFERAVRDFAERCSTPDSNLNEIREQGAWLYSQLLQPVIAQLPESQVVVVELDRSAYNLSMEALTSPAGWYFGEKYPVVYSPGIQMEEGLHIPSPIGPQQALLLLDASRSPDAGFLPGMESQRNTISQIFTQTTLVNSSSTTWNEIRPRIASSQIFHYMGHGRRDGSGTTLVLNNKESLRAKDIAPELFGRLQLVVLAACSTAAGRESGLLDANSLIRAFLTARVPRVVASHWDVDSESTSHLMISFYHHVTTENSIAQAIYHARKEILASHPHPYYWASFSLTGRAS